jgi:hypothetical protein
MPTATSREHLQRRGRSRQALTIFDEILRHFTNLAELKSTEFYRRKPHPPPHVYWNILNLQTTPRKLVDQGS